MTFSSKIPSLCCCLLLVCLFLFYSFSCISLLSLLFICSSLLFPQKTHAWKKYLHWLSIMSSSVGLLATSLNICQITVESHWYISTSCISSSNMLFLTLPVNITPGQPLWVIRFFHNTSYLVVSVKDVSKFHCTRWYRKVYNSYPYFSTVDHQEQTVFIYSES